MQLPSLLPEKQGPPDTDQPPQSGRIVAHHGANFAVMDQTGHLIHCLSRKNLPKMVCGDYVTWQQTAPEEGVIVALHDRHSLLSRPDFQQQLKPVAANVDQIFIVVAPKPEINEDLINRYLVAATLTGIKARIILNKIDLLKESQMELLQKELFQIYDALGYDAIFSSTKKSAGLKTLHTALAQKTSIFAGQSGVGKSSLIQALLPNREIRVGELSAATGLGKHTTTVTMLYPIDEHTAIIDSPGIREFGLSHVSQAQIAQGFVEFAPYLGECKFNDCTHLHEPGCGVRQALQAGRIFERRYASYARITASLSA
jgi:ribosome biogenesis GTPase